MNALPLFLKAVIDRPLRHPLACHHCAPMAGSHSSSGRKMSHLDWLPRNTSGTGLFLLPVVLLLLSVLVAPLCAQTNDSRAKQFYSKIVTPVTLIDLFRNFKIAMDGDLLLRDDFYTEDNLRRFSGGKRIVWGRGPPNARGDIADFGSMVKDAQYDGRTWAGLGIQFSQNFNEDRVAVTGWLLTIGYPNSVSFSEIEAIFGTSWENRTLLVTPPHGPPPLPAIIYKSGSASLRREMVFSFSNGKVGTANFILRRPIP